MNGSVRFARPCLLRMKAIAHLFLLVSVTPWILATDNGHANQEDDIREAVFRHLMTKNPYTLRGESSEYCLAVGFRKRTENADPSNFLSGLFIDPSDKFMGRFLRETTAHKGSSCRQGLEGGVRVKRTDKPALLLSVTKITWVSDTEVKVEADYTRAPLASEGFVYVVKRESGGWRVVDSMQRWIS